MMKTLLVDHGLMGMDPLTQEGLKQMLADEFRCHDFDEDCEDIPCKVGCWLYDPTQGWCPYLKQGSQ